MPSENQPKKLFWKFEFFVFVIGSLSAYYTFCRMKLLDNEHDERIKERFMFFPCQIFAGLFLM